MKNLIIFLSGAAIGGAVVWFYQERKYETLIDEEIESVKRAFAKDEEEPEREVSDISETLQTIAEEAVNKPSSLITSYREKTKDYVSYSKKEEVEQPVKEEKEVVEKPYIIDQSDFKEYSDYTHVTLDYYQDGVLADADYPNEPIDDISEIVGDCLKKIDEDKIDDWIYVRNDSKKSDYEIFINDKTFSEREDE